MTSTGRHSTRDLELTRVAWVRRNPAQSCVTERRGLENRSQRRLRRCQTSLRQGATRGSDHNQEVR
jgi:hypothetical protein